MALADKMKVKRGGGLFETSATSVQKLAAKQGLATTPATAVGTTQIGGNKDQAKMAGTPAQKQKAVQLGATQTLAQARAATQPESVEATTDKARAEALNQTLGNLGTRVNQYTQAALSGLKGQTTTIGGAEGAAGAIVGSINQHLTSGADASALDLDPGQMANLYTELGGDIKNSADMRARLKEVLPDLPEEQLELIADQTIASVIGPDGFTLSDLNRRGETAWTDEESAQVASDLGISPEDLGNMTIPDLEAKVKEIEQEEFAQGQELRDLIDDPNASPSDRQVAKQRLKELGVVGVLTTEDEFNTLVEEIESADAIKIGDKEFELEEILSVEGMNSVIGQLGQGGEIGEAIRNDPKYADFVSFFDNNKNALEAVTKAADDDSAVFEERQANYRDTFKQYEDLGFEMTELDELGLDFNSGVVLEDSEWQDKAQVLDQMKDTNFLAQFAGLKQAGNPDQVLAAVGVNNLKELYENGLAASLGGNRPDNFDNIEKMWKAYEAGNTDELKNMFKSGLMGMGKDRDFSGVQPPEDKSDLNEWQSKVRGNPDAFGVVSDNSVEVGEIKDMPVGDMLNIRRAYPDMLTPEAQEQARSMAQDQAKGALLEIHGNPIYGSGDLNAIQNDFKKRLYDRGLHHEDPEYRAAMKQLESKFITDPHKKMTEARDKLLSNMYGARKKQSERAGGKAGTIYVPPPIAEPKYASNKYKDRRRREQEEIDKGAKVSANPGSGSFY